MNEGRFHGTLKHWDFILIDLLCLQGGFLLSYHILRGSWDYYNSQAFLLQGVMFSICQLLVILFFDQYHGILRRKRFDEFLAVCKMIGETLLLELTILFILHNTKIFSRLHTSLTALVYIVIDYLLRQANKRRVKIFYVDDALYNIQKAGAL